MAKDMFDQVKFLAGLGVFAYALYSIWGVKKAGLTPIGLGLPEYSIGDLTGGMLGGPGYPDVRGTANCNDADNTCSCPNGDQFQMGPSRTCADCTAECAKRGGGGPADAESMVGFYYGRPVRDHGLDWSLTGWEKSDAVNRLTVA